MESLSERAKTLLCMIDENTDIDWETGIVYQYFQGQRGPFWVSWLDVPLQLWQRGDRERLRDLMTQGLIQPAGFATYPPHTYKVTWEGHMMARDCYHKLPEMLWDHRRRKP